MPPGVLYLDGADADRVFPHPAPAASDMASQGTTTNQAATVALTAAGNGPLMISQVEWSYTGSTTPAGNLNITGSAVGKVRDLDINDNRLAQLRFDPPLIFGSTEAVTITLGAGGAGVTGKVACVAWQLK